MTVRKTVIGAADIEAVLIRLPERIAKNVTTTALMAGGRVLAAGINERAPKGKTGKLSRSAMPKRGKVAGKVEVGFRTPRSGGHSPVAHLIEFGTGPRKHKSGKFVGAVPAQPFIRPAIDQDGSKVIAAIGKSMGAGVAREAGALAKGKKSFVTGRKI